MPPNMQYDDAVAQLVNHINEKEAVINGHLSQMHGHKEGLIAAWQSPEARPKFDGLYESYADQSRKMIQAMRDHAENVARGHNNVTNASQHMGDSISSAGSSVSSLNIT